MPSRKIKLLKIVRSPIKGKKYRAIFSSGKKTDFGAKGYSDYTKHKSRERKNRYLSRHRKRENWNSLTSPGALSRWILWNKPSFRESVADYKRKLSRKR